MGAHERHALVHLRGGHVVAHDQSRSRFERLGDLLDPVALDLDHTAGPSFERSPDGLGDREATEVIVLDKHAF